MCVGYRGHLLFIDEVIIWRRMLSRRFYLLLFINETALTLGSRVTSFFLEKIFVTPIAILNFLGIICKKKIRVLKIRKISVHF